MKPVYSGASVPASLKRIVLNIAVAGQSIRVTLPVSPNLSYTFTWNGLDAYNRKVQGMQPVSIRIGYVYPTVYQTAAQWQQSFANFSGVSTANRARQEYTIWQAYHAVVGTWDARGSGLGGWTLGVHHFYDPGGQVLYYGDGTRRNAAGSANGVINTVAGTGVSGFSGDGHPALTAQLSDPQGIAVAGDGSYYIADTNNNRIQKFDSSGAFAEAMSPAVSTGFTTTLSREISLQTVRMLAASCRHSATT